MATSRRDRRVPLVGLSHLARHGSRGRRPGHRRLNRERRPETGIWKAETTASKRPVTFNRSAAETKRPHEKPPGQRHLHDTGKSRLSIAGPKQRFPGSCLSLRNGLSLWDLSNDREVRELLLRVLCLCRKNSRTPLTFVLSCNDDLSFPPLGVLLAALMWDGHTAIYKLARKGLS